MTRIKAGSGLNNGREHGQTHLIDGDGGDVDQSVVLGLAHKKTQATRLNFGHQSGSGNMGKGFRFEKLFKKAMSLFSKNFPYLQCI